MIARLTFLVFAAFWVTMNVLLWRMEFGSRGGDMPVPLQLVWRKILTAPDASSLSVYQNGDRTGYCELSTSVGQQMATLDENRPPPEGFAIRAGYQLHFAGNISLGDFTNRLKFDGRIQFSPKRDWEELNLKITSHLATLELHSLETNQMVHVRVTSDNEAIERDLPFADLENPNALIRAFTGNFADAVLATMDLPDFMPDPGGQKIQWSSRRTRIKIGSEYVPVYRLETSLLGRPISVDVSTLGEILRVQMPGNVTAVIDELNKP
ncbi:MAG: hypothetical protein ABSE48_05690 [Verrucomicrobiota bacterium]|jgi:hypothetical protein